MLNQIFILVSFILGIIVGSLITYVIMGNFFTKAVTNMRSSVKKEGDEEHKAEAHSHVELLKLIDYEKNKVVLILGGVVFVLMIVSVVIVVTGKTITSAGTEKMQESFEAGNVDGFNSAIKNGAKGK